MVGEYEERYPDAYGRSETTPNSATAEQSEEPPHQANDRPLAGRFGLIASAAETPQGWLHSRGERSPDEAMRPARPARPPAEPDAPPPRVALSITTPPPAVHRGRGPRGYVRTTERIREDLCDRLTENPFVDASDIEVSVSGSEVILEGTVDGETSYLQTQAIAEEIIGVTHVHNHLAVRPNLDPGPTTSDAVNRLLGSRRR